MQVIAVADDVPQVVTLEPRSVKPGTIVNVTGVALGKAQVEDSFLTDHRFDLKVKVLEQTPTSMKFRVPPFIKPGRHQLLLQTTGDKPTLLEQPVYVVVDLADTQMADNKPLEKDKGAADKGAANSDKP